MAHDLHSSRRIIAVFGVSGVGKSTLITRAIARCGVDVLHLQASQLIKMAKGDGATSEELRKSPESAIIANQHLLVSAFHDRIRKHESEIVVFDGHSIIDNGLTVAPIPSDIIRQLGPVGLIFVTASPQDIVDRRTQDTTRSRPIRSLRRLEYLQDSALDVCRDYQRELAVPLDVISSENTRFLASLLAGLE